ncbi:MAG: hypothetical protein MUF64_17525 [Polyangiaceae bacterium]|jgi:hypothetical protein|nr:hypothetical protein [Polyangiaceae bacterium]
MRPLHALAALALALTACAAPSRAQRVQEAAYELNVGLRFGHTSMALEKVASQERAEFLKRHRHWNGKLRVVDVDLVGMNVREGEADVFVSIQWQRSDLSDVFTSVIQQKWKDHRGTWLLTSEALAQGDKGLFLEETRTAGAEEPREEGSRRYQTTIIR